jgi:hypothetical protein
VDATQSNSANQPLVVANQIAGLPAVQFNGSSSNMQFPQGFANFTTGAAAFIVANPSTISNYARLFDLSNGASGNGFRFFLDSPAGATLETQSGTTSTDLTATSGVNAKAFQLLEIAHNGSGTASILLNGSQIATSGSMNNIDFVSRADNFLGCDYSASNLFNGNIAEVILYNRALNQSDQSAVESYLLSKYQLLSTIPGAPIFSLASGTLSEPQQVGILGPPGSKVYFTLDGSVPGPGSNPLVGPIQINYTTTVKAVAILNGVLSSVSTATYTLDPNKYPSPTNGDATQPVINLQVPAPAQ